MSEADITAEKPYLFDAVLYPHRSLKREHFSKLLLILIVVCTLASLRFLAVGAWPVVIFLALDIAALWFAFWLNYRRQRTCETIRLTDNQLIVRRIDLRGNEESWVFEPYWANLRLMDDEHYGNRLKLSEHGKQVMLGGFLAPHERKELYAALSDALYKWKNQTPAPAS